MAGIGFELRKLYHARSGLKKVVGSFQGAIASSGPWILSMSMLLGIHQFVSPHMTYVDYQVLLSLYIYLFTFSLLISAPLANMVTRGIADAIYGDDLPLISDYLLSSTIVVGVFSFWTAYLFMSLQASLQHLALDIAWLFASLSMLWTIMVFSSALKDYKITTLVFGIGLLIGLLLMIEYSQGSLDLILRFYTVGVAIPLFSLLGVLFREFGLPRSFDVQWILEKRYWPLFFSGLFLNLGIWADKLIYWAFSHHSIEVIDTLRVFPAYDMAAFLANLLLIPAFTYFIIFVETDFATAQHRYLNCIEMRRGLDEIETQRESLTDAFFGCLLRMMLFQALLSLFGAILFPAMLSAFDMALTSAPLLRICLINVLLQLLIQTLCVLLYYFDCQKEVLFISLCLLISSISLTYLFRNSDFRYVGLPYFASLMIAVQIAVLLAWRKLRSINYYTFMQSNV